MTSFYIRIDFDALPPEKKKQLALREERNYPVLDVDREKSRLLIPDDKQRLLWVPMALCRFMRMG